MDCCHFAEMDGVCTQAFGVVLWAAMRLLGEKNRHVQNAGLRAFCAVTAASGYQ